MRRLALEDSAADAAKLLQQIQPLAQTEVFRHGLIMTPARGHAEATSANHGTAAVSAIALGPAGEDLARGFESVRDFVRSEIYEAAT
jgi:hypothetical protein